MRKILFLFALLLLLPLMASAQDIASLGVDTLTPAACQAQEHGSAIDLYCGPTQGFYRAGEETLDLAKPYVFFGQFDCWAMVAQGTPESFGPVGWVECALLDALPDAPELAFHNALTAMIEEDTALTNNPLSFIQDTPSAHTLARGTEVIILAQMDDWLYIQTEIDAVPARMFIRASALL